LLCDDGTSRNVTRGAGAGLDCGTDHVMLNANANIVIKQKNFMLKIRFLEIRFIRG
jgi:hypothetical protein